MFWVVSLSTYNLRTISLSALLLILSIRSLKKIDKIKISRFSLVALPLEFFCITLYLNKFRKKLAISKFDWPFTPNYKSSQCFATHTSSVLLRSLIRFQPVHS